MPFIKNNLFLIALVASVLIVCGVGLAVYFSVDTDVMAKIAQRTQLAGTIKSLGAKPVNAETLKTQQAFVAGVKAEYQKVLDRSREINKRGRVMMTVEPNGDKPIAIFPVDKVAYGRHSVELLFVPKYKREMTKLLSTLNPVKPPTQEEITYAIGQVTAMMAEEQAINGPAGAASTTSQPALLLPAGVDPPAPPQFPASGTPASGTLTSGTVSPTMAPVYIAPPAPMAMPTPPSGIAFPTAPGAGGPMDEVSRRAMNNLKFQKANTPGVYATDNSLYVTQLPTGSRPTLDQMWMALVGWWLQQDLVAAIIETNQAAATTTGPAGAKPAIPTIAEARIKRLVGVEVNSYVGASQTAASAGTSMSMAPMGVPQPLLDGLTERTSCIDYDVVTYAVRMVMKSSEVQAFQRNLEKRNFYTVLSVNMTAVEQGDATGVLGGPTMTPGGMNFGNPGGALTTEAAVPEQYYYYGPDPVMMVTLKIEAIFFTDWERDLMPVEMLGKLQTFWRPEDSTRYTAEATPAVTP